MNGIRAGMPIVDWTTDEVFAYLIHHSAPWQAEYSNTNLIDLYAEAQGECPLAIANTGTDANGKRHMSNQCSGSRMGCYVCTLVNEDTSLVEMSKKQDGAYDGHIRIRRLLREMSKVENGLRTGIQRVPKKAHTFMEGYGEVGFEGAILLLDALYSEGLYLRPDEIDAIEREWNRRFQSGEIGVSDKARQLLDRHRDHARWQHPEWFCNHCGVTLDQKERRIARQSTHGHVCLSCLSQELGHETVEQTLEYVNLYICPLISA
jgi:3'-phosphoadenosine 5'-phosphosulfate sulfotransferase (PAPS reductase)/FAD synthetase